MRAIAGGCETWSWDPPSAGRPRSAEPLGREVCEDAIDSIELWALRLLSPAANVPRSAVRV
jgi:hypothetical protein